MFMTTPAMPNSSSARPISLIDSSMWGMGVAAKARNRSSYLLTRSAYLPFPDVRSQPRDP